jgi:hypothetical protein
MSGASGLGAALSQYSSAVPSEGQPNILLTRRASGSFLSNPGRSGGSKEIYRTRAQSPMLPTLTQFQDRNASGKSPMLYPSMLSSLASQHQGTVDPPSALKGERQASNRSLAMESNVSLPRDATGALSSSLQNMMVSGGTCFHLHS